MNFFNLLTSNILRLSKLNIFSYYLSYYLPHSYYEKTAHFMIVLDPNQLFNLPPTNYLLII